MLSGRVFTPARECADIVGSRVIILGGEKLHRCTIFLKIRLSAPQQEAHVRLAAHPFSPPAPFLVEGQNVGVYFAEGILGGGVSFRRMRNFFGVFFVICSTRSC